MDNDDWPRGDGDPDAYGYPGEHVDNEPIGEYADKDGNDIIEKEDK